jgi:hypothetical protein
MREPKKKTSQPLKTLHNKKAMLDALEKSLGVVTSACKSVGVSRWTYYDWLRNDEEFKKQVDDIQNIALDFAESQLHKQIQSGNISGIIFYLKTKGKDRGYIERVEQHMTYIEGQLPDWLDDEQS